jgi:integrase/recombinase XerD
MNDMDLYMEKYLDHLAVMNFVPLTIKAHRHLLNRFRMFLSEMGIFEVAKVLPETLGDYQTAVSERVNLKGEPISPFTQNNNLKVVKAFFRFLVEENYLLSNPSRNLRYARRPKVLPRSFLTKEEMRRLLKAPDTQTALGYRDRTMLELMYSTGLRRAEVSNITLADMDSQDGFLRVNRGKGRKDRVVPLGKIACGYVENYVKAVRPMLMGSKTHPFLFVTDRGNPCSNFVVGHVVKQYAAKAKLEKNVTPHTLRHTCATLMMKNRAHVRHIQELLGHELLSSTQVYTQVTIVDLKAEHRKYHPREREQG